MNRSGANLAIDAAAFAAFVFLTATGVLVRYVLPPRSGHFRTLWGLDRHEWGHVHFWTAVAFLAVLAVHLALHWRWIACMIRGRPREGSGVRVAMAAVGVLGLVGIAVSPFFASVEYGGEPPHRMREVDQSGARAGEIDSMVIQTFG